MSALTADVERVNYGSNVAPTTWTAADSQTFYQGSIVLKKSDGLAYVAVPYTTGSGQILGHALVALDTTIAANHGKSVIIQPGTFGEFDNSGTAAIAQADRGKECFAEDDNTISLTNQSSTLNSAGTIYCLSDDELRVVVQYEVLR